MAAISSPQIEQYKQHRLNEAAKPATENRELEKLGPRLHSGYGSGLIFARPKISKLKEENVRSGFFEREEFNGVLQHLPEKLQLIARVAYVTGWRHGEVVQLRRKNLDLKRGLLRLNPGTTKNDEGRAFPVERRAASGVRAGAGAGQGAHLPHEGGAAEGRSRGPDLYEEERHSHSAVR
jgi:integrase